MVIRSPSLEMADWLSAACRRHGLATLWQRPPSADRVEGAAAAIFDGSDLADDECNELKRLAAALKPAPVVALLAFPRAEHYRLRYRPEPRPYFLSPWRWKTYSGRSTP